MAKAPPCFWPMCKLPFPEPPQEEGSGVRGLMLPFPDIFYPGKGLLLWKEIFGNVSSNSVILPLQAERCI